jgi:uncharacterized protein YeaO (DUF488 family)
MLKTKRVYDPPEPDDGVRFLVDHIWPRGTRKDLLKLDGWLKDVAPSNMLRTWFAHDPARWDEFRRRYSAELDRNPQSWRDILQIARDGDVTLLYAARDTDHNNAIALCEYLERQLRASDS